MSDDSIGAIEKFREANPKGPHFADPLEMWGEALIYSGQRDEAQRQFGIAKNLDLSMSEKSALASWAKMHG